MQIYRDDVKQFLEDKLLLQGIRSGTHTIRVDGRQIQHFVDLVWGAELNYYKHKCYVGTLHSIKRHPGMTAEPELKIQSYIYVPGLDDSFYLKDITATGDTMQQALSTVNLVSIRRKLSGAYRLNLEINTKESHTTLSFDMSAADESLSNITTTLFELISSLVTESANPALKELIETRQLPNRG